MLGYYSTAKAEQTYFAIRGGKAKRVDAASVVEAASLITVQPRRNKHYPRLRHGKIISTWRSNCVFTRQIAAALGIVPRNDAEPVSTSRTFAE
ncbi:hypothetical protein DPMN_002073 [Dreissena polymorpha]|uniref:Uncharacterized protein n=1 Tax=Dreissena polymorpha TaxID=45954 RepID=A0A9D4MMX7_DREPO|nr:hypothetical protein DPMN_002073 [Dreissena polymorpha]